MQAVDVYLMYCALKAHFKGDYDYHRFSGQTKVSRDGVEFKSPLNGF